MASGGRGGSSASGGQAGASQGGTAGGDAGDYGFTYRAPGEDQLDWLCTLKAHGPASYVYVRLTQTGMANMGLATVPLYTADLAQISIEGAVSDVANPEYDYGGGHHNDSLSFDHDGKTYRYYHSSFGFGFRKCQPMDCVDVHALGASEPETEGCAPARALPEVCVAIDAQGGHPPLTDGFQKCPGDSS